MKSSHTQLYTAREAASYLGVNLDASSNHSEWGWSVFNRLQRISQAPFSQLSVFPGTIRNNGWLSKCSTLHSAA